MAKQTGPLLLGGKAGGLVFYTNRYGNIVRTAGTVSKERYLKDPSMARRRDAATEFGYAAKLGKLFRLGVKKQCAYAEIGSTHNKLSGAIMKATQMDDVNARGQRRIVASNAELLKGFNWRETEHVGMSLRARYDVTLDVAAGTAGLEIVGLVPARDVILGEGATHVQFTLVLCAADDGKDMQVNAGAVSDMIDVNSDGVVDVRLSCDLPVGSGGVWIAGIGVVGYQEVGGKMMVLQVGGAFEIGACGVS